MNTNRTLLGMFILAAALRAAEPVPVLAELFTSEGCSSCPPADRLLQELDRVQPVAGARIIVLSEHVDYWNRIGWADPYSSPAYSARQEQYARRFHTNGPYTPQMVVDGAAEFVGSDAREAESAIRSALRQPKSPVRIVSSPGNSTSVTLEVDPLLGGKAIRPRSMSPSPPIREPRTFFAERTKEDVYTTSRL